MGIWAGIGLTLFRSTRILHGTKIRVRLIRLPDWPTFCDAAIFMVTDEPSGWVLPTGPTGLPSYSQLNLRGRYPFTGLLEGLDAEMLLVRKDNRSGVSVEDRIAQDRVDMSQINLVLNYHY